jgi:2-polyprenyl-6-methoxyphenol hydroxylase-like FAD-dependent oxidoreductase
MWRAPINESGVMVLFGMLAEELGFRIELVTMGFPDCEALRLVVDEATGRLRWRRLRIEFEYLSRNFRSHRHDPRGCDLIVCWEHDWTEGCQVAVLELKSEIAKLARAAGVASGPALAFPSPLEGPLEGEAGRGVSRRQAAKRLFAARRRAPTPLPDLPLKGGGEERCAGEVPGIPGDNRTDSAAVTVSAERNEPSMPQSDDITTPVAIVGGGPVGLVLALYLDFFGVRSTVFNTEPSSRWHPKGNGQNARVMEIYRRLGFADEVRRLGLPPDHPFDQAYFTRLSAHEIYRFPQPCLADRMAMRRSAPATDQLPEPMYHVNQMYVERYLLERARTRPHIDVRFGWEVDGFSEDDAGVRVHAVRTGDGVRSRAPICHPGARSASGTQSSASARVEDSFTARRRAPTGSRIAYGVRDDSLSARPDPAEAREATWRAQYVVACDGGHSLVRRTLGIDYEGDIKTKDAYWAGQFFSIHMRIPDLYPRFVGHRRAWMYWAINPDAATRGVLIALNGVDEFMMLIKPSHGRTDVDTREVAGWVQRAIGAEIPVDVIGYVPWVAGHALVAERFKAGRILIAGDAAHLFTPSGGFGMNTGIDDSSNIAWKLAALLQGWGGPRLLDTYETERKPIGYRNTGASRAIANAMHDLVVPPEIEDATPAGEAARRAAAGLSYIKDNHFNRPEEKDAVGVQLGARYDGSPVIVPDGAPPPESFVEYTPSGVPGGRAPHVWLDGARDMGSSLFDRFGRGFTLLRLRPTAETRPFERAAAAAGVPLAVLDVPVAEARDLYGRDLALVRPDHYLAWRGDAAPEDAGALFARVCGH